MAALIEQESWANRLSAANEVKPLVELHNITSSVLSKVLSATDEVTCAVLQANLLVLGTIQGILIGIQLPEHNITTFSTYPCCICSVSLDKLARFCALGMADGRITVVPVVPDAGSEKWCCEHGSQPVRSIALCPEYSSQYADNHFICTGGEDGRLLLTKRVRFGGQQVIHDGEGAITRISWQTVLIAWANSKGVKVFNFQSGQKVTFISKPGQAEPRSMCCLAWGGNDTLLVAWGCVVKLS